MSPAAWALLELVASLGGLALLVCLARAIVSRAGGRGIRPAHTITTTAAGGRAPSRPPAALHRKLAR